MNKVGVLFSRMRKEEKLLFDSAKAQGVELQKIDSRNLVMDGENPFDFNVILDREISHTRSLYVMQMMESIGIRTINSHQIASICGDKVATTAALNKAGVPNLKVNVAFTPKMALEAIESMGYPVVLKPVVGSWGRLLAKINDRDAAEAIVEHKSFMPAGTHSIYYIQEYMVKPGRDIRAFYIGGETICAIYRSSEHWITNTARGGETTNCPVTKEISDLCEQTAKAVGSGLLAIDIMETDRGLMINEVNHKMEFRNSIDVTGVDIPGRIIDYALNVGEGS